VVGLRTATRADIGYLLALAEDPQIAPFLAPPPLVQRRLEAALAAAESAVGPEGLFVIEAFGRAVGGLVIQLVSPHSRLCELTTLMVDPAAQGSGVGSAAVELACRRVLVEYGFHRVQAETYGDNAGAQRMFERVGFVREGARRRAYRRRDRWLDGVLFGLLAEELRDAGPPAG
jgi:RimJ/RimL family protein N-acetyltransferase